MNEIIKQRYKIVEKIGEGGMSEVYVCRDLLLGAYWAAKIIHKTRDSMIAYAALKKETELLVRLQHKHIPKIIDCIDREDAYIVIMELIKGRSLYEIAQQQTITEHHILQWANELLQILHYLHHEIDPPVLFCDLKPANLLLDEQQHLVLIDFGIALELKEGKAKNISCLGTKGYAPKEQFYPGDLDQRTDIYAFGATLFYLYIKQTYQGQKVPHVRMRSILMKCLEDDREKRYQSIDEIQLDIKKLKKKHTYAFSLIISVVFLLLSWYSSIQVAAIKQKQYSILLNKGEYEEAIAYMPSIKDAYLYLYDRYKKDAGDDELSTASALQQMKRYSLTQLSDEDRDGLFMEFAFDCMKMGTSEYYRLASLYLQQIQNMDVALYRKLCDFLSMHQSLEFMDVKTLGAMLLELQQEADTSIYPIYTIRMYETIIDLYFLYASEFGIQVYDTILMLADKAISYVQNQIELDSEITCFYEDKVLAYYYQANTYHLQLQKELAFALYQHMLSVYEELSALGYEPSENVKEKLQTAADFIEHK